MAYETGVSSTLEDYLEAIAAIIELNGHAHTKDISEKLGVTMPSVSSALQTLSAKGLIRYQPHSPVILTARGSERAAVIRRRHAALRKFFEELLKLDNAEADATACKVEHVLSEKIMSRFSVLTEAVLSRPDCLALREYLATSQPEIREEKGDDSLSLANLKEGQSGTVVRVSSSLRGIKKFADLGIVPGTFITLEGHAPFGDLLRVRVMGSSLSMRSQDAGYILVRPSSVKEVAAE